MKGSVPAREQGAWTRGPKASASDLRSAGSGPRHSLAEGPDAASRYVAEVLAAPYGPPGAGEAPVPAAEPPFRLTYLDAGIMNYVYRLELPDRTLYLKQALPRVKQHERLGPELAGISPARIRAEWRALERLHRRLPPCYRGAVPRPAWYDAENNILWTEALTSQPRSLQEALEADEWDERAATALGRLLGAVHAAAPEAPGEAEAPLWDSPEEDRLNWERLLRMRTVSVLAGADLPPEAEARVRALHDEALRRERPGTISHLDAAPKNVLLLPGGAAALLDFELGAAISDPAYDVGFAAGHYRLLELVRRDGAAASERVVRALTAGYRQTGPATDDGFERRVTAYAAATMLYRIYGSSPAPFVPAERRGAIRRAALSLLLRVD